MKLLVFFQLLVLFVLALSQTLSDLPSCARNCLDDSIGNCSLLDAECICNNSNYVSNFFCCSDKGCRGKDQAGAYSWASQLCSSVSVTLGMQPLCTVTPTSSNAASSITDTTTTTTAESAVASSSESPSASQSSDEETPTPAASSAAATVTVTSPAAPPTEAAAPSDNGTNIGIGVGIGVGGAVVLLLLLLSLALCFLRRRASLADSDSASGQSNVVPELGHNDHYAAVGAGAQDGFELSSLPSDYQEMPTPFNSPRPRSELLTEVRAPPAPTRPAPPAPPRPARAELVPGVEGDNFFEV